MSSLLLLEPLLFNNGALANKIGFLANPAKNTAFAAIVLLATSDKRVLRVGSGGLVLICLCLPGSHFVLPALTNTLFTIHPPLLYMFAALSISSLLRSERRASFTYSLGWGLSMFMGGYWSMQELSWGGWWNWDVIECGIAYQWTLFALLAHKSYKGYALALSSSFVVGAVAIAYTTLNKLGVGVSIHSFVTSRSTQNHYSLVIVTVISFLLWCWPVRSRHPLLHLSVMLFFYGGTRAFYILKPVLVWATAAAPIVYCRRPPTFASHLVLYVCAYAILAANFDNSSFFFCYTPHKTAVSLSCCGRFWHLDPFALDQQQKLIWDGLWLSKPRYSYNNGLEAWATRSASLRSSFFFFFK